MDAELLDKLDRIIGLEEKFLPTFADGTSQHSLLRNRIQALRTARELISEERIPAREELEFALPRIESIIRKVSKARDKYEPGNRNYRRFAPTVQVMEQVRTALLRELEGGVCGLRKCRRRSSGGTRSSLLRRVRCWQSFVG